MTVIATPQDVCQCGHIKTFHVWIKQHPTLGESAVDIASCYACDCLNYVERLEELNARS